MTLTVAGSAVRRPTTNPGAGSPNGGNDGKHSCSRFLQLQRDGGGQDLRDFDTERRTDLVVPQVKQS
jgi:hypothetical protein